MEEFLKEGGKMIKKTTKVSKYIQMEVNMKDTLLMAKKKAKDNLNG